MKYACIDLLAEFASVVEAVRCAVEIQESMIARNADVPEDKRLIFRVGVNLGDIIIDGDDIHGDGVNVAARLEGLANPGGVCISQPVLDQIEGKLEIAFEDTGEHKVKNIKRPVHVWRWGGGPHRRTKRIQPYSPHFQTATSAAVWSISAFGWKAVLKSVRSCWEIDGLSLAGSIPVTHA